MEARWLAQREFRALCHQRLAVSTSVGGQDVRKYGQRTETLWSKKNKTHKARPKGKAIPTHLPSSSQNRTSHGLSPAGMKACPVGSVVGFALLKRPQYAIADDATREMGMP